MSELITLDIPVQKPNSTLEQPWVTSETMLARGLQEVCMLEQYVLPVAEEPLRWGIIGIGAVDQYSGIISPTVPYMVSAFLESNDIENSPTLIDINGTIFDYLQQGTHIFVSDSSLKKHPEQQQAWKLYQKYTRSTPTLVPPEVEVPRITRKFSSSSKDLSPVYQIPIPKTFQKQMAGGIPMIHADIADNHFPFPQNTLNFLSMINVLYHLRPDQQIQALKNAQQLTKVDSVIVVDDAGKPYLPIFQHNGGQVTDMYLQNELQMKRIANEQPNNKLVILQRIG